MGKFMVTGGAGFIGGHIVELLISEGHDVIVFDDFSTGSLDNLCAVANEIEIVTGDIRDIDSLNKAMRGVEHVIHQAAEISNTKSVEDPAWVNSVNVDGTLNVLISARDAGVKRFTMASSCAIYGDTGDQPQREDFLPHPLSPYGASKICGEHYLSVFYQIYGLETVRLRYFNVFGPRQNPASQYAAVIPKFIDRILAGREIHIYGDGQQTRDFVYVQNVARANYLACTSPDAAGGVFNIASGMSVDLTRLASHLQHLAGKQIEVVYDPPVLGDIKYSTSDISNAREKLGYSPLVSFEEGLERTFIHFAAKANSAC
ncbi:MAG: SDR family oxidoreductase [Armatimonadetes bacterium]|nr:SDR family oxidoreductase [Armatimonadota bacterium]